MKTLMKKVIENRTTVLVYVALGIGVVLVGLAFGYGLEQSDEVYRQTMGL